MTAAPPLTSGERVLRRSTDDAQVLVATNRALYYSTADEEWRRIGWADVAIVGWSRAERAVTLRLWPSSAGRDEIRIAGDPSLAAFVDERVTATRLLLTHAEIRPGLIATVTAVRSADDETVRWRVFLDDQDAAEDPAFQAACQRVIGEIRGLAGL